MQQRASIARALSFDADSAPFIMYSHARSCSIKKKVDNLEYIENEIELNKIELNDSISKLLRTIMRYEDYIEKSVKENKPNHFCSYMLELSAAYNAFYRDCTIINENEVNDLFFKVSEYSRKIINRGCKALGIIPLDSM